MGTSIAKKTYTFMAKENGKFLHREAEENGDLGFARKKSTDSIKPNRIKIIQSAQRHTKKRKEIKSTNISQKFPCDWWIYIYKKMTKNQNKTKPTHFIYMAPNLTTHPTISHYNLWWLYIARWSCILKKRQIL